MKKTYRYLSLLLAVLLCLGVVACNPSPEDTQDSENTEVDAPTSGMPTAEPNILFTEEPTCNGVIFYAPDADSIRKANIVERDCWLFECFRQQTTNIFYLSIDDLSLSAMDTERVLLVLDVYVSDPFTLQMEYIADGELVTRQEHLGGAYAWRTMTIEMTDMEFSRGVDGYDIKITTKGAELTRIAKLSFVPVDIFPSEQAAVERENKRANMENTLLGLFDGTTTEIVEEGTFGLDIAMHFPDFVRVGDEIYAYYIGADQTGKMGTCLAISRDNGATFQKKCVVLNADQPYDVGYAAFAGVWYEEYEELFYMVYEAHGNGTTGGQDIALAISEDGITFEKLGVILDEDDCPPAWCRGNVGTPDLYKEGDVWYVFFHGYNGDDCQIGVAYGEDLFALEVYPDPIVPTNSKAGAIDSGTTGRRDVVKYGDTYFMVYEVSSDKVEGSYSKSRWTHMFAYSTDLIHWTTIESPLVDQGDHIGMGYDGPAWLEIDGDMYVYFRVTGGVNYTKRAKLIPAQ